MEGIVVYLFDMVVADCYMIDFDADRHRSDCSSRVENFGDPQSHESPVRIKSIMIDDLYSYWISWYLGAD